MPIVLSQHTLPDLEALLAEVKLEIASRENAAEPNEASPAVATVTPVAEPAPEPSEPAQVPPAPAEQPAEPPPRIRFVHPASRNLTWTGEGETPEWITAYLAHGGSWSAMENAADKLAASHRLSSRLSSGTAAARTQKT